MSECGVLATVKNLEGLSTKDCGLIKTGDSVPGGFRYDEASDGGVVAGAQRCMHGIAGSLKTSSTRDLSTVESWSSAILETSWIGVSKTSRVLDALVAQARPRFACIERPRCTLDKVSYPPLVSRQEHNTLEPTIGNPDRLPRPRRQLRYSKYILLHGVHQCQAGRKECSEYSTQRLEDAMKHLSHHPFVSIPTNSTAW